MDVIRLRTMTEKSIIGFGKYTDLRVQDLLNMNHTRDLRWIYYNCSLLTFMPNILEEIGITSEFMIEKPGKDHDLGLELNEIKKSRIDALENHKKQLHLERKKKAVRVNRYKRERLSYSKAALQTRNHGNYSF